MKLREYYILPVDNSGTAFIAIKEKEFYKN